jgi:hypothetical protein
VSAVQIVLVALYLLSAAAILLTAYVYKEIRNRKKKSPQAEFTFPERRSGTDRRSAPETKEHFASVGR